MYFDLYLVSNWRGITNKKAIDSVLTTVESVSKIAFSQGLVDSLDQIIVWHNEILGNFI